MEKNAHSSRLRAQINQIAQVAIELSIKRGTTSLTILKAERRSLDNMHKPFNYWTRDLSVVFEDEKRSSGKIELGMRVKEVRTKRGLSQTELAKLVGVTPSTISQVESNLIYPSLPALVKMAEVLSVEVSSFFQARTDMAKRLAFSSSDASEIKLSDLPGEMISAKLLTPVDFDIKGEPYLIEIAPEAKLPSHFFVHKGEELGYMLSGKLHMAIEKAVYKLRSGDVIYLTSDMPSNWSNPGPAVAKLLWIKIR
jgi:transcriptional regulator with XRE-family HTH domain